MGREGGLTWALGGLCLRSSELKVGWDQRACERRPTANDAAIGGPALASSLVPPYALLGGFRLPLALASGTLLMVEFLARYNKDYHRRARFLHG